MSQAVAIYPDEVLLAARSRLLALARRQQWLLLARVGAPALAAWGLLVAGAHRYPAVGPVLLAVGLVCLAGLAFLLRINRLPGWVWSTPAAVARQLNRLHPALEDSAGLLLQPAERLPLLGQLQQGRVAGRLAALADAPAPLLPTRWRGTGWLTAGLLAAGALLWWVPMRRAAIEGPGVALKFSAEKPRPGQPAAPRLGRLRLLVTPPAYTRLAAFAPPAASFACPQGAWVRWRVPVSGPAAGAPELEIGGQRRAMRPVSAPGSGTTSEFEISLTLNASALYRLRYAGQVSEDYAIEARPDQVPIIQIQSPKSYTLITACGVPPVVPLRAVLRDDYGLTRAELVLTLAQGQGEAVKFRELRRDLSPALAGQPRQTTVASSLDLRALGLAPGDELYAYLTAQDNHGQTTRSDTYLVQWQDTAAATMALSMGLGVSTAPAYFRSQRQLIIDTEKLLAERPKLSAADFARRANELGQDQQTLRLRYGKFLGEEAEKGLGAAPTGRASAPPSPIAEDDAPAGPAPVAADDHDEHGPDDHDHEHDEHDHGAPPASIRRASPTAETDALTEPYTHKHDDAETADFLEPAVKVKLHAVLDEMWAAELRLRTGQPAAARPYEYRALRLLKEVQQQTRAYVRKAGIVLAPPPEAGLRLSGDLTGAAAPRRQATVPVPADQPAVRAALRALAGPTSAPAGESVARALDGAAPALAAAALARPASYLPALAALRRLGTAVRAGSPSRPTDLMLTQRALTDLLPLPAPAAPASTAPDRLARRYWQELAR